MLSLRPRATSRATSRAVAAGLAAVLTITTLGETTAHADNVDGKGKGIAGGILLGAEVVAIPMSLFGVRAPWAYAIFPALGAVGGGIAGWGVESATGAYNTPQPGDGRGPIYMLAGGLALVIPTFVLIFNATMYRPPEGAVEDQVPKNVPPANPGNPGGSSVISGESSGGAGSIGGTLGGSTTTTPPPNPNPPPTPKQSPQPFPRSLLDVTSVGFRMGLPIPEVRDAYSLRQVRDLGVQQFTEVRLPVLAVTF